jgi:endonuclease YncB( thermonuclease family)
MQILPTLLAAVVAAVAAVPTSRGVPEIRRSGSLLVTRVVDGDTIDVSTVGRVRLLGIDAPEIGRGFDTSAPFGREARDRLASMVLRRWVRLEREGPPVDSYNRHLAYVVREDGVFVNAALVRDGLARVTARLPLSRLDELKRAEAEAQHARRGMWGSAPARPAARYTRGSGAKRSPASKSKTSKPSSTGKRTKKTTTKT